jgi:hypothetical protein
MAPKFVCGELHVKKKKKKNNLTQVVYFTGGDPLPDVITLEYPNFENPVD